MSKVSYFQRYSQKENHVTNNTLLMFRYLYQHSSARFEKFLRTLIEDMNLDVGLVFEQQTKSSDSVPDVHISQKEFNVFIEAKLDGALNIDQIKRHIKSANGKNNAYIIGLSKNKLNNTEKKKYQQVCRQKNINFASITYTEIVSILRDLAKDYESDLIETIEDYKEFLSSQNMIINPFELVSFPCGTSWAENIEYGVYYEPEHRISKARIPFIGIYTNKTITHLGRIRATVIATYDGKKLNAEKESGTITDKDKSQIVNIIKAAKYYPNLGSEAHRYYIIDDLQPVNLIKTSQHGIQGIRYFSLKDFSERIVEGMSNSEIRELIKNKSFI